MLKRVLLCLLTLCLALPTALPAPAAAANAPVEAAAHHGHGQPAEQPQHDPASHSGKHLCIGCAVATNASTTSALIAPPPMAHLAAHPASALPHARAGPDTPPPRS